MVGLFMLMATLAGYASAAPGLNLGWASASGGSTAAGVISNSKLGQDSFSIAHGGNSVYGNGGNAGTVVNSAVGRPSDNIGWASASGGSAAAGVISNSQLGADSFSIAHGGNSVHGHGGNAGNVINLRQHEAPRPVCTPLGEMLNKFISIGC